MKVRLLGELDFIETAPDTQPPKSNPMRTVSDFGGGVA
jgi:hypothetical protein